MTTALSSIPARLRIEPVAHDQFIVSHGKSVGVGVFTSDEPLTLRRGQTVVVETDRGLEVGTVLCPATLRQARILGAISSGSLQRSFTRADEERRCELAASAQQLFEACQTWARRDGLALEILDVDLLFDGVHAIIQFAGRDSDTEKLAEQLETHFKLTIRLENVAGPIAVDEPEHGSCGKPDCGKTDGGGGCSTCSTGGGCSSCGSNKTDLSEYFSHLRTKMESGTRIPLA